VGSFLFRVPPSPKLENYARARGLRPMTESFFEPSPPTFFFASPL